MAEPLRILVVDDEPVQRDLIGGFLARQGYEVGQAGDAGEALAAFDREPFDLVLTDQRMPGASGLDLLAALRGRNPELPVIVMTAYGTIETAVAAVKAGAADYLTKPLNLDEVLHRVRQTLERRRLAAENRTLRDALRERYRIEGIIGESGRMQEVVGLVTQAAPSEATVLVRGESGTGKELIARALHAASRRAAGPLVAVNCAALPETLMESELFGHEKGAFTGAATARKGRFELADGGTLFLDEIGDLPLHLQVKLLRVLQERVVERLGSSRPTPVNVRLVAATHRDLEAMVREGRFRDDLYYRINVVTVLLPPLRERREDIPPLIDHFVRKFAAANGKPIEGLTREARDLLLRYDYPGNIRELENLVERAVVLTRDPVIDASDLPLTLKEPPIDPAGDGGLTAVVEGLERRMIRDALARAGGVQTRAAELLGISERVLRYKLGKYGLTGPSAS